jgi:CP family cyanate transporter-like MFS transporter
METVLLVVSVAALGFNLRATITSLPPVFPELASSMRLSPAVITILATTPVVCFGVVSGVAARLSRRLGEERVMIAALVALTCGLLLRGILPGPMLFPGTVLACSAIAVMNVLMSSMIKRRWAERAGFLIGIYLTAMGLGAVIGSVVSVPLYNGSGGSVRLTLGWLAAPAGAAALVVLSQLRHGAPETPAMPVARVAVHRHALAWQVTAFMGIQSLLYYATLSWLPTIFRGRGSSPEAAGNLLALMGIGGLAMSLVIPVLAQRAPDQRRLVIPPVIATAAGIAGSLYAPLGSAPFWMLLLGVSQGSILALAIFFTMARAPDPVAAASLSSLAQAVGYLVAAAGPLEVGFLHTATGGWNVPVGLLLVLTGFELLAGMLAARSRVLPAGSVIPEALGAPR